MKGFHLIFIFFYEWGYDRRHKPKKILQGFQYRSGIITCASWQCQDRLDRVVLKENCVLWPLRWWWSFINCTMAKWLKARRNGYYRWSCSFWKSRWFYTYIENPQNRGWMIKSFTASIPALWSKALQIILSAHTVISRWSDKAEIGAKFWSHRYAQMILMDIRMPVMDGTLYQGCRENSIRMLLTFWRPLTMNLSSCSQIRCLYCYSRQSRRRRASQSHSDSPLAGAMINPNIPPRSSKSFHRWPSPTFCYHGVRGKCSRRRKIIQQITLGLIREIAAKLYLSKCTVRNYLSGILSKLNLRDRLRLSGPQTGVTQRDLRAGSDKWSGDETFDSCFVLVSGIFKLLCTLGRPVMSSISVFMRALAGMSK